MTNHNHQAVFNKCIDLSRGFLNIESGTKTAVVTKCAG